MTTAPLDDTTRYHVGGEGVAWRETGGEIVVLDVEGSVYFGLNGSGAELWRLLSVGATRAELCERLRAGVRVAPERARADVDVFLARLDTESLLHRGSGS